MKKIIFLFFLTCTELSELSAQFNLSLSAGVNYSNFNTILFGKVYYDLFQKYNKFIFLPNLGVELTYTTNKYKIRSGIFLSQRGFKDTGVPGFIKDPYIADYASYIEIPVEFSYLYCRKKIESGLGLVFHRRNNDGFEYYGERNKPYGLGIKVTSMFHVTKRIGIKPSYTFGNVDKYILNTYSNFLHHVFAMNVVYDFYRFGKKKK